MIQNYFVKIVGQIQFLVRKPDQGYLPLKKKLKCSTHCILKYINFYTKLPINVKSTHTMLYSYHNM